MLPASGQAAPEKDMCQNCAAINKKIKALVQQKEAECVRRILTGQHRKKLKQPERQGYYSRYYQANREKKLAYCREKYQQRKQDAQTT